MTTNYTEYTILVVEDELPLQTAVRTKLEGLGINVATARTVDQARDYLHELPKVDAIWLDHYLLGNANGLEFVAELKAADSHYQQIPVFVVSNSVDQEKINSYLRLGVEKYYTKSDCRLIDIVTDVRDYLAQSIPS